MRVEKPLTQALERGAGVQSGTLNAFVGKPSEELASFIQLLPDDSPLKPFAALLGSAVGEAGQAAPARLGVQAEPAEVARGGVPPRAYPGQGVYQTIHLLVAITDGAVAVQ